MESVAEPFFTIAGSNLGVALAGRPATLSATSPWKPFTEMLRLAGLPCKTETLSDTERFWARAAGTSPRAANRLSLPKRLRANGIFTLPPGVWDPELDFYGLKQEKRKYREKAAKNLRDFVFCATEGF